jgi:hypothetical protein
MRRRLGRRAQLVRARARVKNEVHAVLMRCLKGRPPAADLFGVKGRRWLADQQLAVCARETVDSALRPATSSTVPTRRGGSCAFPHQGTIADAGGIRRDRERPRGGRAGHNQTESVSRSWRRRHDRS